jgi:hypothetical protein
MLKVCSNCSRPAQFSLVAIISTLGVSERLQKSSPAVLFCDSCLQKFCDRLHSNALHKAVNNAYTTLKERLRMRSAAKITSGSDL